MHKLSPVKGYNGYSIEELRKLLAEEKDSTNIRDITNILNAHLQKKDVIRKSLLADLQDKIQALMERRITERGDNFSNKDLLDYFKVVDDTINKIDSTKTDSLPQIQVNQQEVNINLDKPSMSREEKNQVVDAVKAILQRVQNEQIEPNLNLNTIDGEFKEIENDGT